nr:putative F420-dependent oxidoreductase, Rv1855c family [uncultured bacterium]
MIELAIMIEGQHGLTWERWQRMARAAEDLGFAGLYRSDHYTDANPPDLDSLECWVSLTWLASHTSRIEFGPLVSPVSFRQPTMLARMATAVDDLSGGRLTLGVGAGWQEREHTNYDWELLDVAPRFDRYEEGLEIISHLINKAEPFTFDGTYYQLHDAVLLPRPHRATPILVGGNGMKKTLSFAAQYAAEWNGVFLTAADFAERNTRLTELLTEQGRDPMSVRRSLMTGSRFGKDEARFQEMLTNANTTVEALQKGSLIYGTSSQVVDQLGALAEAGVQRVMMQWLDLDDMDGVEALAAQVLPQLKN